MPVDSPNPDPPWGRPIRFVVEVTNGGRTKRNADGSTRYWSPVACPFNYGSAVGTLADDGDPLDVVILGDPLPVGFEGTLPLVALVQFEDLGFADHKWVLSPTPPQADDFLVIDRFFRRYASIKRWAGVFGRGGGAVYHGLKTPGG